MPGYRVFEDKYLKPYKANGIKPHNSKMGFLDFLREVKNSSAELPRLSKYCVVGISELLFSIKQEKRRDTAAEIRRELSKAASDLEKKAIDVQIVCKGKLIKGESLYLEYRQERLPIDLIFGNIGKEHDTNENEFYRASCNLTSG